MPPPHGQPGAAVVLGGLRPCFVVHGDMRLSTALSFLTVSGILVFVALPSGGAVEDLASVGLRLRTRDELLTGGMLFAAGFSFTG